VSEIRTDEVAAASPTMEAARPSFAHESEVELARILDFYAVRWEYEPHTFPILWNLDGEVLESFSPDFYLPDLDLYVELTTLKQRLVRKKNRKLRRLRELYPEIRIKLFYGRDFRALMLKYGKLVLPACPDPGGLGATHDQSPNGVSPVDPGDRCRGREGRARASVSGSGGVVAPASRQRAAEAREGSLTRGERDLR
jgi:hypothetical protein